MFAAEAFHLLTSEGLGSIDRIIENPEAHDEMEASPPISELDALRAVPAFDGLPEYILERAVPDTKLQHWEEGATIIKKGDTKNMLCIIKSGTVGFCFNDTMTTGKTRSAGCFGEISVC